MDFQPAGDVVGGTHLTGRRGDGGPIIEANRQLSGRAPVCTHIDDSKFRFVLWAASAFARLARVTATRNLGLAITAALLLFTTNTAWAHPCDDLHAEQEARENCWWNYGDDLPLITEQPITSET